MTHYATIKELCTVANLNSRSKPVYAAQCVADARKLGATRNDFSNLLDDDTRRRVREVQLADHLKAGDPVRIGGGGMLWFYRGSYYDGQRGCYRAQLERRNPNDRHGGKLRTTTDLARLRAA